MPAPYRKPYLEILPAALLPHRQIWRKKAESLPAGTCLLVTDAHHTPQAKFMQSLAQSFLEKGRRVVLWHLDPTEH
ncbi:MAG: hypothetical protein JXM69_07485 [Anaerolineae bacterium]|nr:hypothetical protein [Anaerolineae bacterium]